MTTENAAPAVKQKRPIVPYLKLPENEEPYLAGCRCTSCGAIYLGERRACANCMTVGQFEPLKLSKRGKVYDWTIVYQSAPGIKTPYIAAIVDLDGGGTVRCNIEGIEPDPKNMRFDMPVEMYTEVVRQDREGNDIVAYKFRPI
jgi:uncharacterized OB-fold protein